MSNVLEQRLSELSHEVLVKQLLSHIKKIKQLQDEIYCLKGYPIKEGKENKNGK
jgi:hypothetical protein